MAGERLSSLRSMAAVKWPLPQQPPHRSHESPRMNRRIPTPTQFLNRELGILAFNRRVLAQAADE